MNIRVISEKNAATPDVLAIFTYKNTREFILRDFKADIGTYFDVPHADVWHIDSRRAVLIGLGERGKGCRIDNLRDAAALFPKHLKGLKKNIELHTENIGIMLPDEEPVAVRTVVEGFLNGLYEFRRFKTEEDKNPLKIENVDIVVKEKSSEKIAILERAAKEGKIIAEAIHMARDLGNMPANELTPLKFYWKARDCKISAYSYSKDKLKEKNLNAILAVGSGSEHEPELVVVNYSSPKYEGRPIILVGKGLTFDSGGISLKPSEQMEEMKYDMAGAAAVLATVKAAAELKLPVSIIGLMPLAENKPGPAAIRPGDIIKSYSGKTIEVINTDAEGRLLLADACSFAVKELNPGILITVATLTGACVTAAGNAAAGLMGNNPELVNEIREIGMDIGEKVQTFELFPEYGDQLKSEHADIKNVGGKEAGVITAAMFIQKFIELEGIEKPKWAHLDIAGTAYVQSQTPAKNYWDKKGATGWGVRLLIEFLKRR